jgi:hypothetical protein
MRFFPAFSVYLSFPSTSLVSYIYLLSLQARAIVQPNPGSANSRHCLRCLTALQDSCCSCVTFIKWF